MYELYYDKEKAEIKLSKIKEIHLVIGRDDINVYYGNSPVEYNDCYITCGLREPLKQIAIRLKKEWALEAKNRIDKIEQIKF